jgi:hypothetical protein
VIRAGLRRLLVVFGLAALAATVLGLVAGPLLGNSIQRSLAVGYVLGGAFVMLIGVGSGMRGWGRPGDEERARATSERVASAGVLLAIGFALVLLGIGLDPRSAIV